MSGSRGRNPFSLDNRKAKAMQVPSETKPALWGAAGGAIALAIVGFTWGGWMTTGTANKLADQRADTAVVAILTPICVDKFQQNGDATANLALTDGTTRIAERRSAYECVVVSPRLYVSNHHVSNHRKFVRPTRFAVTGAELACYFPAAEDNGRRTFIYFMF